MPVETATQRGQQTRERLLRAATELIPVLGWSGVTTRKVAERAGLRPGLVHYHFPSVDDLLTEAALAFTRSALTGPLHLLDDAPDLASGIVALVEALDAYTGQDEASLLMVEAYLAATRDARLREGMAAALAEFRAAVRERLAGQVPDADSAAALLGAVLDGLILHRSLAPMPTTAATAAHLLRMIGLPTAAAEDPASPDEEPSSMREGES
ncbi:TetR/AcrR family transcriptional regulator [Salinactinospora qingdaonensis]